MTENHPITPSPELVEQWRKSGPADAAVNNAYERHIATCAAQWGADQELEACCRTLYDRYDRVRHATGFPGSDMSDWLRAARRPKPPSLREQALALLDPSLTYGSITREDEYRISVAKAEIIRRALEQLPE
jgi:hypothetical protein